ncbi:MAG TPA: hypothetical protein VF177_05825 [Anaerolineae bacterium]
MLVERLLARKNVAAALLFLLLALLFMHRALLPPPGQVLGGYDMRGYYYIVHEVVREAVRSGRLPFWDPYRYGGYPFLADPQQNAFYPPAWLTIILPTNVGISWYMVFHIWLAGVGMFAFVRFMGGRWLPAVLSGIAFAFSGLLAGRLWAGHSTVYAIDAWTPWLLLALAWSVKRPAIWRGVLAGLPFGLAILAGHLPSFLYIGLIWAAFALYLLFTCKERRWLVVRAAAAMALIGFGVAAIQLAPFIEFSLVSQRVAEASFTFATDYSLPPAHLITLIIPEFFGEPTRVGYWSVPTFEELTYYAGLLPLLGLVMALRRPDRLTWFYLVLIVFGLWLALGRYSVLYPLLYDLLPPFRVVRAPGRAAFLYLVAAAALLGHALTIWLDVPLGERKAKLGPLFRRTLAIVGVSGVAALAATGAVFITIHPTDTSGRLWHQVGGYAFALLILLIGGALIWSYLVSHRGDNVGRIVVAVALVALSVADLWTFSYKMVRLEPATPDPFWLDAREVIGEAAGRVLPWGAPVFIQNESILVALPSVFGYVGLEPAAHIALASSVPDPRSSAYDVLGAAYVISPVELQQFTSGERPLSLVEHHGSAWVYRRDRTLPLARIVYDVEVVADVDAAIARIHQPDFDPAATAVLSAPPPCAPGPAPAIAGTAEVLDTRSGFWRIRTDSEAPGLLVLAETAYPGWRVTVDGQAAEPLTAYTTVRAVCVPAGEHVIEWTFVPTIFVWGGTVTALSLLLVGVAAIVAYRKSEWQSNRESYRTLSLDW